MKTGYDRINKNRIIVVGVIYLLGLGLVPRFMVLAQSDSPFPDFFVEAEIDNPRPYVGQQITYLVKRYHAVSFPNPPYYNDHPFTGFWHLSLLQRPSYTTTIGERVYQVHQTHIALFPTKSGALTIAPTQLVIPNDGPEADLILESEPIEIEVQPLPEGPPPAFKGAVGRFEIEAELTPLEARVNEVITLTVTLKGSGNLERISFPPLPNLQYWRFFDQEVKTEVPLAKEVIAGSQQIQWSVVAGRPGTQEFPPLEFSYYDPETKRYHLVSSSAIAVTILPALNDPGSTAALPDAANNRQEVIKFGSDIRHIKPAPVVFQTAALSSTIRKTVYGFGLALPLVAIAVTWLWQRWHRYQTEDTPQARRRRAWRRSGQFLAQAEGVAGTDYPLIYRALTTYLSDQLDQAVGGVTLEQLASLLHQVRLDPRLAERTQQLLAQVETYRFSPIRSNQATPETLISDARILLDDLESFFKRRRSS